jgi:tRNA modification GTPase
MDLTQAEAVMDIIHARSERALTAANLQLRGALGHRMKALTDLLLDVLARVEAYIDFPDEDLPPEDIGYIGGALDRLVMETDRLSATSHYGELLRDGIKTVIVGEPNVGKSSLLNRLVGRERALVSEEPGTTRDYIEERLIVGAHCLRLIDTAGLNPSPAPLEGLGMDMTRERVTEADLVLVVLDATKSTERPSAEVAAFLVDERSIILLNKSDLVDTNGVPMQANEVRVSARTGMGIDELTREIARRADAFRADVGEDLVAINARHSHALTSARLSLRQAQVNLRKNVPNELLASDLRAVLVAYGEITGKVDNEQMLDQLFATFCIGK